MSEAADAFAIRRVGLRARVIAALAGLPTVVAACSSAPPAYGEAVIIVDTDMTVPTFVDRLRIDSFTSDGTWVDSHDYALLAPSDWPTSFGVYSADESKSTTVILRLRAYTDGRTRDYRGERFVDPAAPTVAPPTDTADQLPRLVENGADVSPSSEPQPETTIDRLVEVVLEPGKVGAVSLVLKGACVGTMAQMSASGSFNPLVAAEAQTCVDTPHTRVALGVSQAGPRPASLGPSVQGTWFKPDGCADSDSSATVKCIRGGAYFLGGPDASNLNIRSLRLYLSSSPQHVAAMTRFWVDVNEVTVARWRAAVAAGYKSPDDTPYVLDAALPTSSKDASTACTYSTSPRGREEYPLTCLSWSAARGFCQSLGGDLPSEAQWEYVAIAAGREYKTRYPWGGDDTYPACSRAVFWRVDGEMCLSRGYGPQSTITAAGPDQDVSPSRIINLEGNVEEWALDSADTYDSPCWEGTGPSDPVCLSTTHSPYWNSIRGGSWMTAAVSADSRTFSDTQSARYNGVGFRCVYASDP